MLSYVSAGSRHGSSVLGSASAARIAASFAVAFAVALVASSGTTAHAQTIRLCEAPWLEPTNFAVALQARVGRIPAALRPSVTLTLTECESSRVAIVASVESGLSMRRVVLIDGWTDAEKNDRVPDAMIALASALGVALGIGPSPAQAPPAPTAAPAPPAPNRADVRVPGETSAGLAPAVPSAYVTPSTSVDVRARAVVPNSRTLAPMDERRSFSVDGGVRLYAGSTGAYSFRFRVAWPRLLFDYRYAAISLDGTEAGDSVKLRSQLVGVGYRWRHRVGRGALALSAIGDVGVQFAQGRAFASRAQVAGAAALGARADAELVYPFGRARLRLGIEFGYERGMRVHAIDSLGVDHTLGGFDGAFVGFYGGVGFGDPPEVVR